ncbi:MAG TPA: AAA family ATPase [Streptosporangiaceae bacterium]|nr:AAA family ATPase [Streptosporangiaceae bacterium]
MRTEERPASLPGRRIVEGAVSRIRRVFAAAPLLVKILLIAALVFVFPTALAILLPVALLAGLVYAPLAVWAAHRTVLASLAVAVWGLAIISGLSGAYRPWLALLLVLPLVVVAAAHQGTLGRWFAPCRTVAWALGWSVPIAVITWRLATGEPAIGPVVGWVIAAVVLGWRLAKSLQEDREFGRQQARGGALAAPYGWPPRDGGPGPQTAAKRPPAGNGLRGSRAAATEMIRAQRSPDPGQAQSGSDGERPAGPPEITVDEAMAELDNMIGLTAVKDQIRSIAASIEAARRRAVAGYSTDKPMQHMVFLGPPGTGKTAVARIVAKIFYAFGLLDTPTVVEAHRADLVGEYLGATAIKTNELIDSALGGVLFIDEAYGLMNEGDGQADRFGSEAVQALLTRAEDDRDNLIIILAGYERQMDNFLSSNPGLTSRFAVRVKFPGYTSAELLSLADLAIERRGELLDPDARPVLWRLFEDVGRRRMADELGNGRFVRSLLEKAGQARDVRVMSAVDEPSPADLVTLRGGDLEHAFADLTTRFRGYGETPTLESALAELDSLIGLDPVKRQVHEIAAQLRVARLRDAHGLTSQPPARHFVFTGPPGTGKTTVARILGRIFAALGLLVRPSVVEAHRADLVGEHLGATAIKTNKLIDSALGGVLFIDEAYALYNEGYSGGDAFGSEAIAALLKRAEDDRDRLVIVLAGYTGDMDRFLRSNPGLASRFSVRVSFPSYTPHELVSIAEVIAQQAGDSFAPDALPVLDQIFSMACEQGKVDELGNGRFARSLFERACAVRDLRVAQLGEVASAADLTTVGADDLRSAFRGINPES